VYSSLSIIHLSQAGDYVFIFRDTENIINDAIKPLVILKWNSKVAILKKQKMLFL